MIANYLKIAFRNLKKQKTTTLINITGLTIGISFSILLLSYVQDELTFDRFHTQADKIHMITTEFQGSFSAVSHHFLADKLTTDYPEVQQAVRWTITGITLKQDGNIFTQQAGFTDPGFFMMFTFPLKTGAGKQILAAPDQVILSPATAEKYFDSRDPIGQTLSLFIGREYQDFRVVGIFEKFPGNSSLQCDLLLPYKNIFPVLGIDEKYTGSVTTPLLATTFVRIESKLEAQSLRDKLPALNEELYGKMLQKYKIVQKRGLDLHRFVDFHLGRITTNNLEPRGNPSNSVILAGIALAVLLLACFNFMMLSIGRSSIRYKEIGARKVLGAGRPGLVVQFLGESTLISLLATGCGILLAALLLPEFNALTGKTLSFRYLAGLGTVLQLSALPIFIGLLSGMYPALVLSGLNIGDIFRGRSKLAGKNLFSRVLVFLQFTVSIVFIIGTLLMWTQLRFIQSRKLGFTKENILVINTQIQPGTGAGKKLLDNFRASLNSFPGVLSISGDSGSVGASYGSIAHPFMFKDEKILVNAYKVDYDYLKTLGIFLKSGRTFSADFPSDLSAAALVNETLVRKFELTDPVGLKFSDFAADKSPQGYEYDPVIIGVVKDFHTDSLHSLIIPQAFDLFGHFPLRIRNILVRLKPENIPQSLAYIRSGWEELRPDASFEYYFLDDYLNRLYRDDQNWNKIIGYSSAFAIFIACLGLFGLTALSTEQRTKEIGIRKILGAEVPDIIYLLSRNFWILVGLANAAAWPAAYYAGNLWLQGFAYQAGFSFWMFGLAALLVLILTGLTVSIHAVRAGNIDPIRSLRYE